MTVKKWGENSTDDYNSVTEDNMIREQYNTRNYGIDGLVEITNRNAGAERSVLVKFDISALSGLVSDSDEI